jgi:hypothetical protein
VRKVLDGIWKAIDIDGSGGISKDEYDAMHEQMWYAAHELDKQRKAAEEVVEAVGAVEAKTRSKTAEIAKDKRARQKQVKVKAAAREAEEAVQTKRQLASLQVLISSVY